MACGDGAGRVAVPGGGVTVNRFCALGLTALQMAVLTASVSARPT